jgi:hypothetical protein
MAGRFWKLLDIRYTSESEIGKYTLKSSNFVVALVFVVFKFEAMFNIRLNH